MLVNIFYFPIFSPPPVKQYITSPSAGHFPVPTEPVCNHLWVRHGGGRHWTERASKFIQPLTHLEVETMIAVTPVNFSAKDDRGYQEGLVTFPFTIGSQGSFIEILHLSSNFDRHISVCLIFSISSYLMQVPKK